MKLRMNRLAPMFAASLFLAIFASPSVMAAAGKALFVSGSVTLEGRATRQLKAGDAVNLGDVVVTGERSRAQLLMADGARIALRAGSRFRIDELALPSSVQQPALAVAVASSGKSVGTLLKGGFSTRDGAIGKNNPSAYEMRTPIGTLGIRGTYYTAVFCRGDCADAPGLPAGQPIPDGLYLAVDEGTITFNGRGLSLTLTAPRFEFIPLDTSDPQQLFDPPAFLRNDGAGALQLAGRTVRIAASNGEIAQLNDHRSPGDYVPPAAVVSANDGTKSPGANKPEQNVVAVSTLGRVVDLIDPQLPLVAQTSVAVSVPVSTQPAFAASSTELSDTLAFNGGGSLLQLNAPSGGGATAVTATYLSGTAALVDFGSSGSSGIRWGRWSTGASSVNTTSGVELVDLQNASLHWVVGPSFETPPLLPVSGSTNFILAGGTSPTDDSGHVGVLGAAVLSADFTAQQVNTTLSLDVNGFNWFASGSGSLTVGTARFGGTYTNVLVDGRVTGTGGFSGFLSAGTLTPDQLNGAGLGYWLTESTGQLGAVSGVMAFVPGAGQPLTPPVVQRDVAYSVGILSGVSVVGGVALNSRAQMTLDSDGFVTGFDAPVPGAASGTLGIGVAFVTNTGNDNATGIEWGRWEGGNVDVTTPPAPAQSNDITGEALHWIAGNEFGAPPVLPLTGTANYSLGGNTNPTDTLGNVGFVGVASFTADFTNRTVATAMTLQMAGLDWYASGSATFPAGGYRFTGTYDDVRVQNLVSGQGTINGFFTQPRIGSGTTAGAGLSFNLADNTGQLGVVSGVLAFAEGGQGATLAPLPPQERDIAMVSPDFVANGPFVQRTAPADYALDAAFGLTSLPGLTNTGTPEAARYDIGTSAIAESDVSPLVMLRWGRWAGGDVNVTGLTTQTYTVNLGQRSLHWIEGADSAAPPVMPQFGTASYALIGATVPTDRAGNTGILNNASLSADFTNQLVSAAFDITINNLNIVATGDGVIGAQAGLPAHQFSGNINGGIINPIQGVPTGSFSGFFCAPGGTVPGVPGGAGLTYSIGDGQGTIVVDGAAAFRGP